MTPKELEQTIRALLNQSAGDAELRGQLETLAAAEISFSGFTWLFGPELYRRNRILFRPFILSRFSTYMFCPSGRRRRFVGRATRPEFSKRGWRKWTKTMRPIYSADFTSGNCPRASTGASAMRAASRSSQICRRASGQPPRRPSDRPSCASSICGFSSMRKTPAPFTNAMREQRAHIVVKPLRGSWSIEHWAFRVRNGGDFAPQRIS